MGRDFYDGVDASRLPTNAWGVGGYVDGLYKWSAADWARFPYSVKARIAVFADTDDGHILDVEQGNATPAQSVDWALMRRKAGIDPTVYMNTSTWPVVRSAFQARGVAEPHYWVAQYDGVASIPAGAIGKQYENNEGAGWDRSVVADHWPGIDPPTAATPASTTATPKTQRTRENDMHADLQLNKPVVFTNPGAVTMAPATLLLAADFGDATVRVATFSLTGASWTVQSHPIARTSGAFKLALPPDVNKVSVTLTAFSSGACVGLDVLA